MTFHIAKEFAFEETCWHGAAIQLNQRAVAARALLMDGSGDELLSGATFSSDEDSGISRRDQLNQLHQLSQAGTFPDQVAEVLLGTDFVEQVCVLSLEPRLLLF
jgi:hypothetical protein